jgi:3-isopropylmalate/(R)-2-methylmalate dehydratase large subunit
MTLTEKILARASGHAAVRPGEELWATADRMIMNDSSGPRRIATLIEELGGLWDRRRVVLASDHFVPASTLRHAEILRLTRKWADEQKLTGFYEYEGILHSLMLEERLVEPGMLVIGADSHTQTAGAAGAVAVAVGSTELATILATGRVWLAVPETMRIDVRGRLRRHVDVRDLTMKVMGELGAAGAEDRAVEWGGDFVAEASLEQRLVLANQGTELSAHNAVVEHKGFADGGASYARRLDIDAAALTPLVACPPSPSNVKPARSLDAVRLDMAWLGSCAGGRQSDLEAAAAMVNGRKLAIPMLVTPATRTIHKTCLESGAIAKLVAAGATILPPGCGACAGVHGGVQADGDTIIATATRNFPGRMGARGAQVYLASAHTVAASALAGHIVDPRDIATEVRA